MTAARFDKDLVAGVALTLVLAGGLWAYVSRSRAAAIGDDGSGLPSEYIAMEGAHTKGSASAPAVLLVFSDFQCPFCGRFARETLSAIEREYVARGELLMAFRHLPLPIHPQAIAAAQSAECAGSQGKFWEMHDELFRRPELTPEQFTAAASAVGLDLPRFQDCRRRPPAGAIAEDVALSKRLGLTGTPAIVIGRLEGDRLKVSRVIRGAAPRQSIRDVLRAVIPQKTARF